MFDSRRKKAARRAAQDAIRKETFEADVLRQKALIEQEKREYSERNKISSEQAALRKRRTQFFAGGSILTIILYLIGQTLSYQMFWLLVALLAVAAIVFRKKFQWRAKSIVFLMFGTAVMLLSIATKNEANRHAELVAENTHRRMQQQQQEHARRLAWNTAHPQEVARDIADQKRRFVLERQQENARMAARRTGPFLALNEMRSALGTSIGPNQLIVGINVVKPDFKVLSITLDKAKWDHMSDAQHDRLLGLGEKAAWRRLWTKYVGPPDNAVSIGYEWTSYYDNR